MYRFPNWNRPWDVDVSDVEFPASWHMSHGRDAFKSRFDWDDWKPAFDFWRPDHFDFGQKWHGCGGHPHGRDRHPPKIAPEHEFSVVLSDLEHGLELGGLQATDNRGVTEFRIQSDHPDTDGDGTSPFAITPDGTLIVTDHHDVDFGADGQIQLTVTAHDAAGNGSAPSLVTLTAAPDPLIPTNTPFNYHIGINYESWDFGRTKYSIEADLNQITEYFKLVKTYHAAAVGTGDPTNPVMDHTQQQVIDYVLETSDVELVMGTANSVLAQGGFGAPWAAGLMTDKAYTDKWVQMLIDGFGSTANVQKHLKAILLGNEIDANGPPPGNAAFNDYLGWINTSFDNLKASLSEAGLGSIAVSTTIANYGSTNAVSVQATQHINDNWSSAWNNGSPFVLYNQYTQDNMQSTDFEPVENYFELVKTEVPAGLEVFIGETGYSTTSGSSNPTQDQATVYKTIFEWLDGMDGQQGNGGPMVPMFPFVAFDRPKATPSSEVGFGIFGEDADNQPTGLKPDLAGVVPSWTVDPINPTVQSNSVALTSVEADAPDGDGNQGTSDDGPNDEARSEPDKSVENDWRDTFDFTEMYGGTSEHCGGPGFDAYGDHHGAMWGKWAEAFNVELPDDDEAWFDEWAARFDEISVAGRFDTGHDDFAW